MTSMKPKLATMLAAATLAAMPISAQAETGAYISIFGGANFGGDSQFTNGQTVVDTDFDTGFLVGGAVGYSINEFNFGGFVPRAELEFSYSQNEVGALNFSGNGPGAENVVSGSSVDTLAVFANIYVDGKDLIAPGITPYIGGGVGFARSNFDIIYNAPGLNLTDTDTSFAWQVRGGVNYAFTNTASLFADVGYRSIVDASSLRRIGGNLVPGGPGGGSFEDSIDNIQLRLGVTVSF